MIKGIGIDVVEVKRIEKVYRKFGNRFLKKVYTDREIEFCNKRKNMFLSLASRFAAKEAFMKALGRGFLGGLRWKDIEIEDTELSLPRIKLYGKAKELNENSSIYLSVSHIEDIATAVVVREAKE